jgi:hypothetical protein
MASEPFWYLQHSAEIKGTIVDQLQNNTGSSFYLSYTNYRLRDPPIHAPGMSNNEKIHARQVTRSIKLLRKGDNEEMGHFTIEGFGKLINGTYESFGSGYTNSMTISIEDEPIFRKRGLARVLIYGMIEGIKSEGIDINTLRDQKLFIDVDASGGFWAHIGMDENPRGVNWNRPMKEGNGYEKMTTIGGILDYLITPSKSIRQLSSRSTRSRTRGSPRRSISRSPRRSTRRSPKK